MPGPIAPLVRTRNASATRAAILQAARSRFARHGYDAASVRDIAADAGIDPALINRYFGSKEDLFAEVLASTAGPNHLIEGGLDDFGRRVAQMLVYDDPRHDKLEMLLSCCCRPRRRRPRRWRAGTGRPPSTSHSRNGSAVKTPGSAPGWPPASSWALS